MNSQTPGLRVGAPAASACVNSGVLVSTTLQAPKSVQDKSAHPAIASPRHIIPRPLAPHTSDDLERLVGAPGAIQVILVSAARSCKDAVAALRSASRPT